MKQIDEPPKFQKGLFGLYEVKPAYTIKGIFGDIKKSRKIKPTKKGITGLVLATTLGVGGYFMYNLSQNNLEQYKSTKIEKNTNFNPLETKIIKHKEKDLSELDKVTLRIKKKLVSKQYKQDINIKKQPEIIKKEYKYMDLNEFHLIDGKNNSYNCEFKSPEIVFNNNKTQKDRFNNYFNSIESCYKNLDKNSIYSVSSNLENKRSLGKLSYKINSWGFDNKLNNIKDNNSDKNIIYLEKYKNYTNLEKKILSSPNKATLDQDKDLKNNLGDLTNTYNDISKIKNINCTIKPTGLKQVPTKYYDCSYIINKEKKEIQFTNKMPITGKMFGYNSDSKTLNLDFKIPNEIKDYLNRNQ